VVQGSMTNSGPMSGSGQVISVDFTLTKAEFARSRYVATLRSRSVRVVAAVSLGVLVIGLLFPSTDLWFAGAVWLAAGFAAVLFGPPVYWRLNKEFRAPRQFSFHDTGVTVTVPTAESRIEWALYSGAIEAKTIYVLFHTVRLYNAIPKRVFASRSEEEAFVALLGRHLRVQRSSIL
jgi:hypothetical protein